MSSPTQRSLKLLRKEGFFCDISEHWNSFTRQRKDLFSFVDIVALDANDTLAVQTTSGTNVAARIAKIKACPGALAWLQSPNRRIEVHGWRKAGERGKRKTWQCRRVEVTLEDLHAETNGLSD